MKVSNKLKWWNSLNVKENSYMGWLWLWLCHFSFINFSLDLCKYFFDFLAFFLYFFLLLSKKVIFQLRYHFFLPKWLINTLHKLLVFRTDQFACLMCIKCFLYLNHQVLYQLNLENRTWQKRHLIVLIDNIRQTIQHCNALFILFIHKTQVLHHCLNRVKVKVLIQNPQSRPFSLDYLD